MSRTDKDRPDWVRVNDKTEDRTEFHYHHRRYWGEPYEGMYDCEIDEPLDGSKGMRKRRCGYYLRTNRYWNPKREDRRLYYYKPLRSRERDTLGKAAKQYNAGNEVDEDIVLPESHRHAMFPGGYWD